MADKVSIAPTPDNPKIVLKDLPPDESEDSDFDGAKAPWFLFDFEIANGSKQNFVLLRISLSTNPIGEANTVSQIILDSTQLDEDQQDPANPLALAIVEPESKWQSSVNAGRFVDPNPNDDDPSVVRQGIFWYIDGLPQPANSTGAQGTVYEVNMLAEGYFETEAESEDDEIVLFERNYRFFTE